MSTIICLKEAGRVVLGTDSRFMNVNYSEVESNSTPKITRIGDTNAFVATTGWSTACEFHAEGASELAEKLKTDDIRVLATALDRASPRLLEALIGRLSREQDRHKSCADAVSGATPLQGFLLAGRAGGMLGYIYYEYWYRDGQLMHQVREYFGNERNIMATGIDPLVAQRFNQRPETWTAPAVDIVRRFLREGMCTNPHIGGPNQIVQIEHDGSRWIEQPPAAEKLNAELAHATITASISISGPKLTGTTVVESGVLEARPPAFTGLTWPKIQVAYNGIFCYSSAAAPTIQLEPDSRVALAVPLYIGGQQVVTNRYPATPANLADVIAILRYHGLCA